MSEHLTEADAITTKEKFEARWPEKIFVVTRSDDPKYPHWLLLEELHCQVCNKVFQSSNSIGLLRVTCPECKKRERAEILRRHADGDPRHRGPEPEDNESDRLFWGE